MSVVELLLLVGVVGSLIPAWLFGYWSGLQAEQKLAAVTPAESPPEWLQQAREDIKGDDDGPQP